MLEIAAAQLSELRERGYSSFEIELLAHVHQFAPRHAEVVGEASLRQMIREGFERAARHQFTLRGSLRFYIELMVMFGSGFDTDPMLPWAMHHLRSDVGNPELVRTDRLHAIATAYRDVVMGPQYEIEVTVLRRVLASPDRYWLDIQMADVWNRVYEVYPQKCAYAGRDGCYELLRQSRSVASDHGLSSPAALAIFGGLMVAFGHDCVSDPQFAWIAESIKRYQESSEFERLVKLVARTRTFLSAALRELEKPVNRA